MTFYIVRYENAITGRTFYTDHMNKTDAENVALDYEYIYGDIASVKRAW